MKTLLRNRHFQALLPSVLGVYLSFALRTTRWTLDGEGHFAPHCRGDPAIFAFWHEFLPLMPALSIIAHRLPYFNTMPVHALVSQHRDGRFIGAVVRRFGITPILGSSTRGGAAALRSLLAALNEGGMIGITPDGPRGPARQAAAGVVQLAALSGVPILPCAARTSRFIRLQSWDRMAIPLPFGRGVVVCGQPMTIERQKWKQAVPEVAEALNRAAARADLLCSA